MPRWILRGGDHEKPERDRIQGLIDNWWRAFQDASPDLDATFSNKGSFDVPGFMSANLDPIDHRLCWEFGHALKDGKHRLILTPESVTSLHPLVDEVLARAPKMPDWELYKGRMPDPVDAIEPIVAGRLGVELPKLPTAVLSAGDIGRVNVLFEFDPSIPADKIAEIGFLTAEALVGETLMDTWLGLIESTHVPKSPGGKGKAQGLPLTEFKKTFEQVVALLIADLPQRPWHEIRPCADDDWSWSTLALSDEDTLPPNRPDLVSVTTASTSVTEAILRPYFNSLRHSRFGERFVYIQADATSVPSYERADHRYQLQDALDEALASRELGAVIGGAAGAEWDYIDLAVTDLPRAAGVIGETLRALGVPRPSWLRCHDASLATEWMGIWDNVEPPPEIDWE